MKDTSPSVVWEVEAVLGRLHCCAGFGALGHWAGPGQPGWDTLILPGTQTNKAGSEADESDKLAGGGGENFLTWEDPEALQRAQSLALDAGGEGEEGLMYTYGDWREEGGGVPGRGNCMGNGLGMMRTGGSRAGDGTGDLAWVIWGTWSARLAGPNLLSAEGMAGRLGRYCSQARWVPGGVWVPRVPAQLDKEGIVVMQG